MSRRTRKTRRIQLTTLIVVGEGPHDKAVLEHMKGLYDTRDSGQKVTLDAADGGSPEDIINTAIRKHRHADFDKRYVLMDADVPIPEATLRKARKNGLVILLSEPHCLEGMLLDVLGARIPGNSQACKKALHPQLAAHPARAEAYAQLFPQTRLDSSAKDTITTLRQLLANR